MVKLYRKNSTWFVEWTGEDPFTRKFESWSKAIMSAWLLTREKALQIKEVNYE